MAQPGGTKKLNLKLRKFDVKAMKQDSVVVAIGKRRVGKSNLIADLLFHHRSFPSGTIISGTESVSRHYGNFVPKMFIHNDFNPAIIANIIKRQTLIKRQFDKEVAETGSSNMDMRNFLVLDDCLHDDKWTRDVGTRFLFMNGRHIKTMFIIALQYAMGIPPNLRTNIDYVFIYRESIMANRERLWRQYAGMFPDFDSFCQVMDQCTQNFECLVIDNTSCSSKIEDQVFWYKAEMHSEFKTCLPKYWSHPANFAPDEDEGDELDGSHGVRRRYALTIHKKE